MPTLKERFTSREISKKEWSSLSNQEKETAVDFHGLKEWLRQRDEAEVERMQKAGVVVICRKDSNYANS